MSARYFGFLFFFSFITSVKGQDNTAGQEFIASKFKPYSVAIAQEGPVNTAAASPFQNIEVLDYRSDTSRIGFLFDRRTGHRELVLESGATNAITSFLNNGFANPSASNSLLVVIRKCWISEITPEDPEQAVMGAPHTTRLTFRAETYLKDDSSYIPFAFLDTTITASRQKLQIMPFRLTDLLTAFMEKMISVDAQKALKTKRRVSFAFVDSFSNRNSSHVMNKAEVLQKGVYATLDDFRNNRPTISDYVVESEKGDLCLYLKDEAGKTYFTRKIWGYCDGQQSFVMINGNLYPVLRQKNAYYVFGSKDHEIKTTKIPIFVFPATAAGYAGSVPISQRVVLKFRMYTLDPETGEID